MADLSPPEAEAVRVYKREGHARQTKQRLEGGREHQQEIRPEYKRRANRPPNQRLREAREQAGLSRKELAQMLGVSHGTIRAWERSSVLPKNPGVRRKAEDVLGEGIWHAVLEIRADPK